MPTGNILVEQKSFEEKTWPLNIDVQKAKADRLSVVTPPLSLVDVVSACDATANFTGWTHAC
jgi:hypothetical protein